MIGLADGFVHVSKRSLAWCQYRLMDSGSSPYGAVGGVTFTKILELTKLMKNVKHLNIDSMLPRTDT